MYSQLADQTNGKYIQFTNSKNQGNFNFTDEMNKAFMVLNSMIFDDFKIAVPNAKTNIYGLMNLTDLNDTEITEDKILYYLGKYTGRFPSKFEVTHLNEGITYSNIISFEENETNSEPAVKTLWNALDLSLLEEKNNNNEVIERIIDRNIDLRILGRYTAFLSSSTNNKSCIECYDYQIDYNENNFKIDCFPNPFHNSIEINLNEGFNYLYDLKIFSINGEFIKSFETYFNQTTFIWDGNNEHGIPVKKGIYFIVATYADKKMTQKIMKL